MTSNGDFYGDPHDEERLAANSAQLREQIRSATLGELWVQFVRIYAEQGYEPVSASEAADAIVKEYDKRRCRPGKETWGL